MGKVSELSQLIEELNRCGNTLIGISEDLRNLFSGSEEAKDGLCALGVSAIGLTAAALVAALGGNTKIDLNKG